jgi:hypothetical protein
VSKGKFSSKYFQYLFSGNEYRKTAFKVPMQKFCDWAKKDKFWYENLVESTNFPPYNSCPAIPKVIVQRVENPKIIIFLTNLSKKVIKLQILMWF